MISQMFAQYAMPAVVAFAALSSAFGLVQTARLAGEKASHASTRLEYATADRKAAMQALADRDAIQSKLDEQSRIMAAWDQAQQPTVAAKKKEVASAKVLSDCSNVALPDRLRDAIASTPQDLGATDTSQPGGLPGIGR